MLTLFKKVFLAPDSGVLTQLPLTQTPSQIVTFTHIVVAFALYFIQLQYELFGVHAIAEISIWLLVTANSMVCLFGSCRGFDRVTILELFIAAFISFYYHMHYNIPVIFVMLYQTYLRYEASFGENFIEDPDMDDVFHEEHPDNWRNWMRVGGADED